MSVPIEPLSSTVKAGRLLRLLGWITLTFTLIIGAAIVIPALAKGEPFSQKAVVALTVAVMVAGAYLVVGAGVKQYQPWARVAGLLTSLLSLANVPVGSIIGAMALFHLVRGWREQPGVASMANSNDTRTASGVALATSIAINGFFAFATVVFAGAAVGNGGRMSDFYKLLGIVIGVTFTLFGFAIYRWFKRKPGAVAIPFATVPLIFGGLWLYVIFISDVK